MDGRILVEAAIETLWPTRCALCDRPGQVLCSRCARALHYMDYWQSCPRCGAPWGRIQCDHCAAQSLLAAQKGEEEPRARPCLGCLRYTQETATLIKTYKDKGEQRLAATFAQIMAHIAPPTWHAEAQCVTYVTASKAARRRRGFDHMELIAQKLAAIWELPCLRLLHEPRAQDQRVLGRAGRMSNMEGRFAPVLPLRVHRTIIIDDVLTTGSTMEDACGALEQAGCICSSLVIARV